MRILHACQTANNAKPTEENNTTAPKCNNLFFTQDLALDTIDFCDICKSLQEWHLSLKEKEVVLFLQQVSSTELPADMFSRMRLESVCLSPAVPDGFQHQYCPPGLENQKS